LFDVVACGSIAATVALCWVPDRAFQVTVAAWPSLSFVASASAKPALTCSLARSARSMNPLEPLLPLDVPDAF
jgi:hypothetical protein